MSPFTLRKTKLFAAWLHPIGWKKESCAIWKWIIEAVKNLAIDLHFWQFQIKAKWLDPAFGKEKRRCQWNWTWDIALKSMMILYMYFKNILYFLQLSINELELRVNSGYNYCCQPQSHPRFPPGLELVYPPNLGHSIFTSSTLQDLT